MGRKVYGRYLLMKNFFGGTKDWFFTVMKPFGLMKKNFGNIIAFEVNFRLFTFSGEAVACRQ